LFLNKFNLREKMPKMAAPKHGMNPYNMLIIFSDDYLSIDHHALVVW